MNPSLTADEQPQALTTEDGADGHTSNQGDEAEDGQMTVDYF